MTTYQIFTLSGAVILSTLGVYYLLRTIFIYRKIDKHLFFAVIGICGLFYLGSQFMLARPYSDELILTYHRIKLFSSYVSASMWMFTVYAIFVNNLKFPVIFSIIGGLVSLTIPFDIFLHLPVTHLHIEKFGIIFDYRMAEPGTAYRIYAVFFGSAFLFAFIRMFFLKIPLKRRIFASAFFLPILLSSANDFLLANGIMTSEFAVFVFTIMVFVIFFKEDASNYQRLQKINQELEDLIKRRTQELSAAYEELKEKNELLEDRKWHLMELVNEKTRKDSESDCRISG